MKKIENAIDVGYYRDYRDEGEDEDGTKYYGHIDNIESTIKARNKDGWKLVNTNVHPLGSIDSRYFLFWEREVLKK